jgi:isopentenyl-diphosphate delta-isomerase
MQAAGTVRYDHPDPVSGLVEREYNHLFVGRVSQHPHPDPAEVGEVRFAGPAELAALRTEHPFSVWFGTVLDAARPALRQIAADAGW